MNDESKKKIIREKRAEKKGKKKGFEHWNEVMFQSGHRHLLFQSTNEKRRKNIINKHIACLFFFLPLFFHHQFVQFFFPCSFDHALLTSSPV
jgi:hypothetical protein